MKANELCQLALKIKRTVPSHRLELEYRAGTTHYLGCKNKDFKIVRPTTKLKDWKKGYPLKLPESGKPLEYAVEPLTLLSEEKETPSSDIPK